MKTNNEKEEEIVQKGYLYLVKNPSFNEISVCASDQVFYPGTKVVVPTRFGHDMGIVIGDATTLGQNCSCCTAVQGACHLESLPPINKEEDNLKAAGEPEDFQIDENTANDNESENCFSYKEEDTKKMVEIDGAIEWITRMATPEDMDRYHENIEKEKIAITQCMEKIQKNGLNMKLVGAHFLLVEPKVLFFFTADDRVDFRGLVKDLVSVFRMRIELRQIGVRDEARILGGLAFCGRDFCCHSISDKLRPVTIKMAKEQNLSLNSVKISGPCGRLLCCLSYEYDFYEEEKYNFPCVGNKLRIGRDLMRINEINIISREVKVASPSGAILSVPRSELNFNSEKNTWVVSQSFQKHILDE